MKKIQEEKIIFENELSFKSSFPSLRNYFFWHYHPELELVYIEAPHGIRNVGKHISNFTESDLILIGPNIPHLNFDYGIKTHYYQAVIQMKTSLVDVLMDTPECNKIKELLERSYLGLSFKGKTKKEVARRIKDFKSERKLDGLLDLIKIFQILAESNEFDVLNTDDMRVRLCFHDKIRMEIIYNYVHENYHNKLNVHEIAQAVNLTTSAFCRYFKKQTNLTFTNFANSYRISMAKIFLLQNISVSEVCYQVGFNSISYFSTLFKKLVGKTPMDFKSK
ncbi:AraC family transcriptional regulator [Chryseobacterium potabilaquae]|uniref:Bifunctional transcriptional activator/DNA repair enzyme AdaA n=1 Tax=Chryseobacterium potabilaquae TaxID=2675057 RepID=A0A6N4X8E9_9FLAO|nr:AraC family transcriptional regulator [Chryseobacterium potabilaquae]CAA7197050.1 Bifunctional transcriptional activator/DNA repair enzyme AdaA [Chryseobacterium potabilaquae]